MTERFKMMDDHAQHQGQQVKWTTIIYRALVEGGVWVDRSRRSDRTTLTTTGENNRKTEDDG